MHSNVLVVALLATVAIAAPTESRNVAKRSFKVERVANPKFVGYSGTSQLIKSYAKYGLAMPEGLIESLNEAKAAKLHGAKSSGSANTTAAAGAKAAKNQTGNVTATPEAGDIEYLSPVTIGGQTMVMDFDSGSSDLWVFNTQLPAADTAGHTLYNPTKSTTFKLLKGASFSISYGDGSGAAGNVGTDEVNIGGATVTSQAIEMATAISQSFVADTQSNGLVGLAFSQLNTVKPAQQKTFFDNVSPTLAEPVFTADLRHDAVGAYEFGNIDSAKFNGSLAWAAVNTTSGFWQFASTSFAVDGGAAQPIANGQAIADTGTTLIIANPAVVNGYYSKVKGAVNNATVGGVTFPCNSVMPDLALAVGNSMATVPGQFINFTNVDAAGTSKLPISLFCLHVPQNPILASSDPILTANSMLWRSPSVTL